MSTDWIPYGRQSIDESDIAAVEQVLRSDWLTTGPAVEEFEAALENVTGAPTFVVSSGTAALHSAYAGAGIGQGDHVIVPAITFIATAAAAVLLGAEVTVVDVTADTLNIDPQAAEAAIRSNTQAIVAVDFAGHPADLDALRVICDRHGLLLIEDASHALGASLHGRPVGSIADLTTFSFHPVKPITTGEGGAVSGLQSSLVERARMFRNHGLVRDDAHFVLRNEGLWHQEVHSFGLNYRMPDINAALGESQIRRLSAFRDARTRLARRYDEALATTDGIATPSVLPGAVSGWHLYPIRIKGGRRREVYEALRAHNIGAQVHYLPIHLQPAFDGAGYQMGVLPVAERAYAELLSIPLYPDLTEADQDRVIETLIMSLAR